MTDLNERVAKAMGVEYLRLDAGVAHVKTASGSCRNDLNEPFEFIAWIDYTDPAIQMRMIKEVIGKNDRTRLMVGETDFGKFAAKATGIDTQIGASLEKAIALAWLAMKGQE